MTKETEEDVRFRVMRALERNPQLSQRDLSNALGVSLGLINYCLKGLVEKGQVKVRNFRASDRKLRYAYVLTPQGVAEKAAITGRFLKRRMAEYEALGSEIEALEAQLSKEEALANTDSAGER